MRLRDETPLPAEVADELAALEAALAGEPVAPGFEDLAALALALRDERPSPRGDFARELDERAAASFPRAGRTAALRSALAAPRRGTWAPALGVAASVAVATVLALSLTGSDRAALRGADGAAALSETTVDSAAPATGESQAPGSAAGDAAKSRPQPEADDQRQSQAPSAVEPAPGGALAAPVPAPPTSSGAADRSVERGASLRLATTPRRLDEVAGRVVTVTDGVGGFVRSSAVDSRPGLGGGATFELQVPVRRLQTALSRLSSLASVRSRNESSLDVTEQVALARDRVAGLKAARRSLLRQLEAASSIEETDRLRERLRSVEVRLDNARSARAQLRQRTSYSAVYVEIVTEKQQGEAAGPWTPRDALDDAVRVLEVAAGVALVALAVLLPLALIAAVAWPLTRAARRRRREGALDAPSAAAAA